MWKNCLVPVLAVLFLTASASWGRTTYPQESPCPELLQFGDRVVLVTGPLTPKPENPGQFGVKDLFLVFQNPKHPLVAALEEYALNARLHPVTLSIERDFEPPRHTTHAFFLYGIFGMFPETQFLLRPQKDDKFEEVVVGLVTTNECMFRHTWRFGDKHVRLIFQVATGT